LVRYQLLASKQQKDFRDWSTAQADTTETQEQAAAIVTLADKQLSWRQP
jgi:hypothetical protein